MGKSYRYNSNKDNQQFRRQKNKKKKNKQNNKNALRRGDYKEFEEEY